MIPGQILMDIQTLEHLHQQLYASGTIFASMYNTDTKRYHRILAVKQAVLRTVEDNPSIRMGVNGRAFDVIIYLAQLHTGKA